MRSCSASRRARCSRAAASPRWSGRVELAALTEFLARNGYVRSDTVREAGEYALRGGIVDIFPPGTDKPLRLDLFGDTLEAIRSFDPTTQLSADRLGAFTLRPVNEVLLDAKAIERFRSGYRELFGAVGGNDPLYEAISAGRRYGGFEHWLPLFHEKLETLFDYVADATVTLDHQAEEAVVARFEQINEAFDSRAEFAKRKDSDGPVYRPLLPDRLYLTAKEWRASLAARGVGGFSPFAAPPDVPHVVDVGGRQGPNFAQARTQSTQDTNVFDALRDHIRAEHGRGRRVLVAAYSIGSRDRLQTLLAEHGCSDSATVEHWSEFAALPETRIGVAVLGIEQGFQTADLGVVSEQDILGDRLIRAAKRRVRAENFIAEASNLNEGDLVVHVDHGVGRFEGLVTITAGGAPHDCLKLAYAGGDRLFVPVENIEILSRYGSERARRTRQARRRRLAEAQGQGQEAHPRHRGELIRIAAQRKLMKAIRWTPPEGLWDEFCARFPYRRDRGPGARDRRHAGGPRLGSADGSPDLRRCRLRQDRGGAARRLRRGDVRAPGRGRGADDAARAPAFRTFTARFRGLPLRIAQLSRMVTREGARRGARRGAEGQCRDRRRHPCAAGQGMQFEGSRPDDRGRGAAFRRRSTRKR
jgi:transcription-repair coupling factor (superfamily II helicase)